MSAFNLNSPKKREGIENDPVLINPKGAHVQVPEERVFELLEKGYRLKDRSWKPRVKDELPSTDRNPKRLEELQQEISERVDLLEVTEI
jgi:hypothetical protein